MVSFSIKPGDQTDETESPNLVNKTVGTQSQRYQSFSFFLYIYIRCSEKFQTEGLLTDLKHREIK